MILDAKTYEGSEGMKGIPSALPPPELLPGVNHTKEELKYKEGSERAHQNNVWKRKYRRIRDRITSLNMLSASLLAAITVLWLSGRLPFSRTYTAYFWQVAERKLKTPRRGTHSVKIPSIGILPQYLSSRKTPSRYCRILWTLLTRWFKRGNVSLRKSRS